ncbi:MAG: hypothetical protein M4D80_31000 [Myxococcota bacterium]|nr:hypothetical protein [Myxococcota bacterium]
MLAKAREDRVRARLADGLHDQVARASADPRAHELAGRARDAVIIECEVECTRDVLERVDERAVEIPDDRARLHQSMTNHRAPGVTSRWK